MCFAGACCFESSVPTDFAITHTFHSTDRLLINKSLTSINLYNNGIGAEGAKSIAEAFKVSIVVYFAGAC